MERMELGRLRYLNDLGRVLRQRKHDQRNRTHAVQDEREHHEGLPDGNGAEATILVKRIRERKQERYQRECQKTELYVVDKIAHL